MVDRQIADGTKERIARYLHASAMDGPETRVVPLTGDASDRRYFRIILPGEESIVLALHARPIEFATLPFANVADLLKQIPLPAPAILGHSDAEGILALEDLGDVTLQAHLGAASESQHAALYREAVALIDQLQRRGAELASECYIPYGIVFDVEKLTWELDFFVRHFMHAYRAVALGPAEQGAIAEEWRAIAEELSSEPRVLCHRDYHSRNLMVRDGRLHIIDFQDARMGPDTYDLASLLRDSYVDLTDRQLDDLVAYFLALRGAALPWESGIPDQLPSPAGDGAHEFRRRFDLMALQRNLKALGTFGYQTTARGNPVYIQYMPRTLRYVRTNLLKYPRFARLHDLLAANIEELR
jgi:aminoglycoside/choline kinase family phosphotransferase